MTACGSCRQEFLILKELLGDKVKIIGNSVEELEQAKNVVNYYKISDGNNIFKEIQSN